MRKVFENFIPILKFKLNKNSSVEIQKSINYRCLLTITSLSVYLLICNVNVSTKVNYASKFD